VTSRGPLTIALALLLVAPPRAMSKEPAGDATCSLGSPASKGDVRSVRATLHVQGATEGASGFWVSDAAMNRAAVRMETCVDGWAKCEVALSVEKGKKIAPSWKAWVIGIGVGIAAGFVAGAAVK
jgi:hypothetical protein